jgi:hypothetical protein
MPNQITNLAKKLFVGRVNDEMSREGVLPLEAFATGRAHEGGLARMLRKMLKPALKKVSKHVAQFDKIGKWRRHQCINGQLQYDLKHLCWGHKRVEGYVR